MRDSVFKKVFLGKTEEVSWLEWLKMLLLEAYLGEQLLEMLSNTSSYNIDAPLNGKTNGWERELVDFIPATFFNKHLSSSITDLLDEKYHKHYQLMKMVERSEQEAPTVKLYKVNNDNLHLLTELKLAYNTIWVTTNIVVDIVVYTLTSDLTLTLFVGAAIEFVRRFKW
jgi:hypothetical protein